MKRITRWLIVGFCSLTMTAGLALAVKPAIRNRQINQAERIRHGVANGSLTRSEARRLTRNQAVGAARSCATASMAASSRHANE
jgi:hypothetical protein